MLKIKIISFFLSLLIAVQMLPTEQIGRMLSTNQWTEELPETSGESKGKTDGAFKLSNLYLDAAHDNNLSFITEGKILNYLHSSDQIPSNHSTDVVSPPPDSVI
ncbi:MAG: hypothetical protein JWQ96_1661 [Segetibacter sp.]|nr:hypothetical protein [Segetibacter sp.]